MGDIASFGPGTDHQQHAALGIDVVGFTARVILRDEQAGRAMNIFAAQPMRKTQSSLISY